MSKFWWDDYPWRMIQTNLPEIAMTNLSADEYVFNLKEMHATVALINAGGIIASYPTKVPFHFQSPYLTGDSLQKVVYRCHDEGIRVIARTDFSKIRRPIYEAHPDWAARFADGVIEDYNGNVHCCVNSAYTREVAPKIVEELLNVHNFDGIFFNLGGYLTRNYSYDYLGICQCDNCKKRFKEFAGMALPIKEDPADPSYQQYLVFQRESIKEDQERLVRFIERNHPDVAIDKNFYSGHGILRNESNTEIGRPLPKWQYSASSNTKRAVTTWPALVSSNATVDFLGYSYRHVSVSPAQQELRLWQNLANCGGLDFYLIGRLDNHYDRSGFNVVRKVFAFHEKHFEKVLVGLRPYSDILLVCSSDCEDEYRGWFRLLTENHFLFDVLDVDRLEEFNLSAYSTVILPNTRYISDLSAQNIDHYVSNGGMLLATGESGFYTENFMFRCGCALGSLGIDRINFKRDDMKSALLRINRKNFFPSLEERDLIYFGEIFIYCEYQPESRKFLNLIPPHPYGPPELCYWNEELDCPGVNDYEFGSGRGVHLPWLPGTVYYNDGYDNTLLFIFDLLANICGVSPIRGNLSPMVEISCSRKRDNSFLLLHLVNGNGHFGNSFFPPSIERGLKLEMTLDVRPDSVVRLTNNENCQFSYENGLLTIYLEELDAYEGLLIK